MCKTQSVLSALLFERSTIFKSVFLWANYIKIHIYCTIVIRLAGRRSERIQH